MQNSKNLTKWTPEEEGFLKENLNFLSLRQLSVKLNKSYPTVQKKVSLLKLERTEHPQLHEIDAQIGKLRSLSVLQPCDIEELKRLQNIRVNLEDRSTRLKRTRGIGRFKLSSWDGKCSRCKSLDCSVTDIKKGFYVCKACVRSHNANRAHLNRDIRLRNIKKDENFYENPKRVFGLKLSGYKRWDKKRGHALCDYTWEELKAFLQNPCYYCGTLSDNRGLDRIDNKKGHAKDNTVPCCVTCNTVRSNLFSPDEMKELAKTILKIKAARVS